jgi:periplasmic divalent cation tolerance protein
MFAMHIVQTTLGNDAQARKMAGALLSSGCAKCVSCWKISSSYVWKGRAVRENEVLLEAKCADASSAKKAAALIGKLHPYDVPMIITLCAGKANATYEKWLRR